MTATWQEAWLKARNSGEPALMLATIMHPSFEVLRLVKNTEAVVSRGETYTPAFFSITWVNDDGQVPRCEFSIPNVDPEMGQRFARQADAPEVTLEVINLARPDEPIARVARLRLTDMSISPVFITGTLMGIDHSSESLGSIVVLPGNFPALYRAQR